MTSPRAEINADMKKMATDVYLTPAYFAVGLTDMAVKAVKQVRQAPAMLIKRRRKLAKAAQADYDVLAERGQQATQDLLTELDNLDNTVSRLSRSAMSTARNAVVQTERAAVAT